MIKKPGREKIITRDLRSRRIKIIPDSGSFKPKNNLRRQKVVKQRDRSPSESEASADNAHDETQHDDLVKQVKNYKSTIAALKDVVDKAKQEKVAISQRKTRMEEAISNRTRGKTHSVDVGVGKSTSEALEDVEARYSNDGDDDDDDNDDEDDDISFHLSTEADLQSNVDDRGEHSRPEDHSLIDNVDEDIYEIEEADFHEYDNDSVDIQDEESGNTGLFTPPHSTSHHPSRARHRYQPYTLSNRLGMIEQTLQRVKWKTQESTDRISRLENKYQKLVTKLNSQETESLREEREERRERDRDSRSREENGVKALVVLAAFGFGAGIATMNIGRALATGFS